MLSSYPDSPQGTPMTALHRLSPSFVILLATTVNFGVVRAKAMATDGNLANSPHHTLRRGRSPPNPDGHRVRTAPVVPLGRMEGTAAGNPGRQSPALCEWRWLTASALACQLKDA